MSLQDWLEELYKLLGSAETPTETDETESNEGDGE